jgi:hypothetical protein
MRTYYEGELERIPKGDSFRALWHWAIDLDARAAMIGALVEHVATTFGIARTDANKIVAQAVGISERHLWRIVQDGRGARAVRVRR